MNLSLLGGAWEGRGQGLLVSSPGDGWLQGQLHWLVTGTVHTHKGPGWFNALMPTVLRVLIILNKRLCIFILHWASNEVACLCGWGLWTKMGSLEERVWGERWRFHLLPVFTSFPVSSAGLLFLGSREKWAVISGRVGGGGLSPVGGFLL